MELSPFFGDWHRSIKLGCGTFSEIWLWRHEKSKDEIVVKTYNLLPNANVSKYKEQKELECDRMINKIRHLNIVRGLSVQPDAFLIELRNLNVCGMPILITEYCNGGNLRRQLNDTRNSSGMMEIDIRNILTSMKNAVFYLHSLSIIHCDIKPESVVIHIENDGRRIYKLTDCGNSRPIECHQIEMGKLAYVAPELIINSSKKYGYSVDYWSLGTLAYEIITGTKPFVSHLPLAQWVLRVREKKSEHITIYEDDNGEFIYSNRIAPENQITNQLAEHLRCWLQLALEWHPKQRGCIFEKSKSTANLNGSDDNNDAPVQVLKFFQNIDDILTRKILNIFVLTNHKSVSMEIGDNTEMNDLNAFIEREAGIKASQCYFIWPRSETNFENLEIISPNRPIDFYTDECFDEPMVFVTQLSNDKQSDDKNVEIFSAEVPFTVQNVLSNHEKRLKLHTLRQFARDALYFVRNENNKYKLCLNGWFAFAVQLNHDIEACQQNVKRMQRLIYGVAGALEIYASTLEMANEKSPSHDQNWLRKITQNIEQLVNACNKITVRHGSLHRRSREACQHELFLKRNTQDFYDIVNCTKAFNILHDQISRDRLPQKPHFELFQCIYKCLKQRDNLLRNEAFNEMQRNLNWIFIELTEIKKALDKAVVPAEKYRSELIEANRKLHENAWSSVTTEVLSDTISTSTTDLTNFYTNQTHLSLPANVVDSAFVENGHSDDDQIEQTKSIIEDNINLRISIADVMHDIDEELKTSFK